MEGSHHPQKRSQTEVPWQNELISPTAHFTHGAGTPVCGTRLVGADLALAEQCKLYVRE